MFWVLVLIAAREVAPVSNRHPVQRQNRSIRLTADCADAADSSRQDFNHGSTRMDTDEIPGSQFAYRQTVP
jgi:hypothetical protein